MIRLLAGLILMPYIADGGVPKTSQLNGKNAVEIWKNKTPKEFYKNPFTKAVITTYWAKGKGTDKWTRKKQSSTGIRLVSGKHVAIDPKVFPYGSKIEIVGVGRFVCVDTGVDVRRRRAARLRGYPKLPVIDIFFDTEAEAREFTESFEQTNGAIGRVRILES